MKRSAILSNIQGLIRDENIGRSEGCGNLADDTAYKILQVFHFSAFAKQLQAFSHMLGIRH